MKTYAWGVVAISSLSLVACGGGGAASTSTGAGGASTMNAASSSTTATTGVTVTTATTGGGTGGGAGACGALVYDNRAACEACVEGSCCSQLMACDPTDTSTPCGKLTACLGACAANDTTCTNACFTADTTGAGLSAIDALNACYASSCQNNQACEYPICQSHEMFPDQTCATCLGGTGSAGCCSAFTTCDADSTCSPCFGANPPSSCATNVNFMAVKMCQKTTCASSCTFDICGSGQGYPVASCDYCLTQNCCTPFNLCTANATCAACLSNANGTGCATNALFMAFTTCRDGTGANECGMPNQCGGG